MNRTSAGSNDLDNNRNVVKDLLLELEGLPPALGSDVVGDDSRKCFEVGGTSQTGTEVETESAENQVWALVGRESPPSPRNRKKNETNGDEMQGEDEVIISPSRFNVLALEDIVEENEKEEDELEEGEMETGELKVGAKIKESSKSGRLRSSASLKLSKQVPIRANSKAVKSSNNPKKASDRKL